MDVSDIMVSLGVLLFTVLFFILLRWAVSSFDPPPIEAPEDDGAEWDANIHVVCWHCGTHLSGPVNGLRFPTSECWACFCCRTAPDDTSAIPSYVIKPKTTS